MTQRSIFYETITDRKQDNLSLSKILYLLN